MGENSTDGIYRFALSLIIVLLFSNCATKSVLNTPSGKPEVVIKNVSLSKVKNKIIDVMLNNGWMLENDSYRILYFSKLEENDARAALITTLADSGIGHPVYRIIFNVIPSNNSIRVIGRIRMIIGNQVINLNDRRSLQNLQQILEYVKYELEEN